MLKLRYKVFIGLFLAAVVWGGFLAKRISYSYATAAVQEHSFSVNTDAEAPDALHFTFHDGTAILHAGKNLRLAEEVCFRYPYGEAAAQPLDGFSFGDYMNGTILVQAASADGTALLTAKASTANTQGYDSFAWDTHVFGSPELPIELCYAGSSSMSAAATVLVYGELYSGSVLLETADGKSEELDITDGILTGLRIQDIRRGFTVAISDAEHGMTLIGAYTAEDYPMFSAGYPSALINFGLLLLLTMLGATAVQLTRLLFRKRSKAC